MLKTLLLKSADRLGALNHAKKLKRGASILFYHGVEDEIINPVVQETHISMHHFERQINYLKKNFEVISLDYLNECISNGHKIGSSQVLLTFDDGYTNNLHNVAPFLRSLNMPFTVFISTRYIDDNDDLRLPYYYVRTAIAYADNNYMDLPSINGKYDISNEQMRMSAINTVLEIIKIIPQDRVNELVQDLRQMLPNEKWIELNALFSSDEMMNWDDVKHLHADGATIGSHCHDHAILHSGQGNAEIDYQLETSKGLIEDHLGECRYFAFPNGRMVDISHNALMSIRKHKYHLGVTTVSGEIAAGRFDPHLLPRIYPRREIDSFKFALNTSFRHNQKYSKWYSMF